MMKTRSTIRRVGAIAGTTLLALAVLGPAASPALAKPGSGSIWTTNVTCESPAAQNANQYAPGDHVYLRGSGFVADTDFSWTITGQPGGASGDPGLVFGPFGDVTESDGSFCVDAYTIPADDWGVYSVDVEQGSTSKNDNYRVDGPASNEPGDEPPADEPPADEPPADETGDTGGETGDTGGETGDTGGETGSDGSTDPADDTVADDPAVDPADEAGDPGDLPGDDVPAADVISDTDEGAGDAPTQEVLGSTSGTTVTPPPTDLAVTDTTSGATDWRIALAGLSLLVLVAILSMSDRTRRTRRARG